MGASGLHALKLLRILLKHPQVNIKALVGKSSIGKAFSDIFQVFMVLNCLSLILLLKQIFLLLMFFFHVFLVAVLSESVDKLPKNLIIIDLSSDFRFQDINLYNDYYNTHKNQIM